MDLDKSIKMVIYDLFSGNPLRRKILTIKKEMHAVIAKVCDEKFGIHWYGAYDIDPKHLVFMIGVSSDSTKKILRDDTGLMIKLRGLLYEHNYPTEARDRVGIDFESQETVDRESNGSWYIHLK